MTSFRSRAGCIGRTPATLEAFNSTIQDLIPNASLSVGDAKSPSHAFQRVVGSTGATAQQVANLTQDMNDLTRASSQSPQPVFLADERLFAGASDDSRRRATDSAPACSRACHSGREPGVGWNW